MKIGLMLGQDPPPKISPEWLEYFKAFGKVTWPRIYIPSIPKNKLAQHDARLLKIAFSPDDRFFVSQDTAGTVLIWDTATWRVSKRLEKFVGVRTFPPMAVSVNGEYITRHGEVRSTKTGSLVASLPDLIEEAAFSPDGRLLAGGKPLRLWEVGTWKEVWREEREVIKNAFGNPAKIKSFSFSRDGKALLLYRADFMIHLMDTRTFQTIFSKVGDEAHEPSLLTYPAPHHPSMGDHLVFLRRAFRGRERLSWYDSKLGEYPLPPSTVQPKKFWRVRMQYGGGLAMVQDDRATIDDMNPIEINRGKAFNRVPGMTTFCNSGLVLATADQYEIEILAMASEGVFEKLRKR